MERRTIDTTRALALALLALLALAPASTSGQRSRSPRASWGFRFGAPIGRARQACRGGWEQAEWNTFFCERHRVGGLGLSPSYAHLTACDGMLCRIIVMKPEPPGGSLARDFERVVARLTRRHGPPTRTEGECAPSWSRTCAVEWSLGTIDVSVRLYEWPSRPQGGAFRPVAGSGAPEHRYLNVEIIDRITWDRGAPTPDRAGSLD